MDSDMDEGEIGCGSYLRDEIIPSQKLAVGSMNTMFEKMLNNGEFSDLKITAGRDDSKKKFHVHKNILATHSGYFKRLCYGTGINFKENVQGQADFPDDDPIIIEKIIGFMYKGHYYLDDDENSVMKHAEIFRTAAYFEIKDLVPLATDRFAYWAHQNLLTNDEEGEYKAVIEALDHIWGNTSQSDRNVLLLLPIARHLERLLHRSDFKELVATHPAISMSLLRAYHENAKFDDCKGTDIDISRKGQPGLVWCSNCQAMMEVKLYCSDCNRTKWIQSGGVLDGVCSYDVKHTGSILRCKYCLQAKENLCFQPSYS